MIPPFSQRDYAIRAKLDNLPGRERHLNLNYNTLKVHDPEEASTGESISHQKSIRALGYRLEDNEICSEYYRSEKLKDPNYDLNFFD